jgi:hypothetical protein
MASETWSYLLNPYEIGTRNNFKRADILIVDHDDKLFAGIGDPKIAAIYNRFHPFRVSFETLFTLWNSAKAGHSGSTRAIKILIKQLSSTKIRTWDVAIQKEYPNDTSVYKGLLPTRRKPFQTGAADMRIQALESLIENIGSIAKLGDVKTEIITFTGQLKGARTLQQGKEQVTPDLSGQLERQRVLTTTEMHRNMGSLLELYADNTSRIESYFQVSLIRKRSKAKQTEPVSIAVVVDPLQTAKVDVVFGDTSRFWIFNYGEVPVDVFVSGEEPILPAKPFTLEAGAEVEKDASELGARGSRFFYVKNNNPDIKAELEMAVIRA